MPCAQESTPEAHGLTHGELDARLGTGVNHAPTITKGESHGFFHENVFARLCCGDDEVGMGEGRGADDDGVDALVGKQRLRTVGDGCVGAFDSRDGDVALRVEGRQQSAVTLSLGAPFHGTPPDTAHATTTDESHAKSHAHNDAFLPVSVKGHA